MAVATERPHLRPSCMTRQRYVVPPIIEALIDIQVGFDRDPEISQLREAGERDLERYPIREPLSSFELIVDPATGMPLDQRSTAIGYRFWSAERQTVFQ